MSCSRAEALEIVGTGGQRRTPSVPLPLGVDQRVAAKRGGLSEQPEQQGAETLLGSTGHGTQPLPKTQSQLICEFLLSG